jgi:hypothetical protein
VKFQTGAGAQVSEASAFADSRLSGRATGVHDSGMRLVIILV